MDITQLLPGLHLLPLGISNAYLWRTAAGVTLVDTGPPGSGPAIRAALDHLGIPLEELRSIVLTHFHDDHAGSAADVVGWSGAEVVVGAGDAAAVRGERTGPSPVLTPAEEELHALVAADLASAPVCRVDREVGDGEVLGLDDGLVVLGVPGHTPGSIALHQPATGALITGDTVAEHQGQVVLGPFNTDRELAWRSLQRLAGLDLEVAGFGHGAPVTGSASSALRGAIDPFG